MRAEPVHGRPGCGHRLGQRGQFPTGTRTALPVKTGMSPYQGLTAQMSQQEAVRVVASPSRQATPMSLFLQPTDHIVDKWSMSPLTISMRVNRSASRLAIRDRPELIVLVSQRNLRRPGEPAP